MTVQVDRTMLVKNVMSAGPIAVASTATPRELARVLIEHEVSGVPVVNRAGEVVGVVSKTDLLQWCVRGGLGFGAADLLASLAESVSGTRLEAIDLGIVADFMSSQPLTIDPEESLSDAAKRMAEHRVH